MSLLRRPRRRSRPGCDEDRVVGDQQRVRRAAHHTALAPGRAASVDVTMVPSGAMPNSPALFQLRYCSCCVPTGLHDLPPSMLVATLADPAPKSVSGSSGSTAMSVKGRRLTRISHVRRSLLT